MSVYAHTVAWGRRPRLAPELSFRSPECGMFGRHLAEKRCAEPYAPDISFTAKSSKQDILQLRDDVVSFLQASDLYQKCLVDASRSDSIVFNKLTELLDNNQQEKQHAADALNSAIHAYNSSNKSEALKLSDAKQ